MTATTTASTLHEQVFGYFRDGWMSVGAYSVLAIVVTTVCLRFLLRAVMRRLAAFVADPVRFGQTLQTLARLMLQSVACWILALNWFKMFIGMIDDRLPFALVAADPISRAFLNEDANVQNALGLFYSIVIALIINLCISISLAPATRLSQVKIIKTIITLVVGTLYLPAADSTMVLWFAVLRCGLALIQSCRCVVDDFNQLGMQHTYLVVSLWLGMLGFLFQAIYSLYFVSVMDILSWATMAEIGHAFIIPFSLSQFPKLFLFVSLRNAFAMFDMELSPLEFIWIAVVIHASSFLMNILTQDVVNVNVLGLRPDPFGDAARLFQAGAPQQHQQQQNGGAAFDGNNVRAQNEANLPDPNMLARLQAQMLGLARQAVVANHAPQPQQQHPILGNQQNGNPAGDDNQPEHFDHVEGFLLAAGYMPPPRNQALPQQQQQEPMPGVAPVMVGPTGSPIRGSSLVRSGSRSLASRQRNTAGGRYSLRPIVHSTPASFAGASSSSSAASTSSRLGTVVHPIDLLLDDYDSDSDDDFDQSQQTRNHSALVTMQMEQGYGMRAALFDAESDDSDDDRAKPESLDDWSDATSVDSTDDEDLDELFTPHPGSVTPISPLSDRTARTVHSPARHPSDYVVEPNETLQLLQEALQPLREILKGVAEALQHVPSALGASAVQRIDPSGPHVGLEAAAIVDDQLAVLQHMSSPNDVLLRWLGTTLLDLYTERQELDRCIVCLVNPRQFTVLDCGHFCICAACILAAGQRGLTNCPMCQQPAVRLVKTFG
ncbi:hypothetical protein CAOG_05241 [Capsaspora owczarzaki ATCC 30864]|uniref:RING-type domain-containing protein n=1 Tax=Capsaspora owczarzaki (strain ATCC 30864) TaxID=595528 RepID=A0A0D2UHR7_CAPO3|nr:hypothetical protein CAOG_05241 [Capsaspora owczarzaki ATCC 30864]KJE94621.1 hypothetical protein CAOG_005241 [Capsaspora owczarzaki ATCC 30864]|eukprot:XP_004346926.1 hypothetical protein CAOG_05241 [Capsaspora owczarzaki ATCC 30864]